MNHPNMKSEPLVVERALQEEQTMTQVHKRFTIEQIRLLYQSYCEGTMSRSETEDILGVGKTRCFLGDDPRTDPRISQALEQVGKLK